jgi:hypothetical protein
MLARLVAAVLAITISGCGVCLQQEYCHTEPAPPPPPTPRDHYDNGHDEAMLLLAVGTASVALVIGLIAIARHTGKREEAPRIAPPPPKEVVFAPIPTNAATEGDQLRLQRMYAQGQLLARIGRCDGVITIGRVIEQNDPAYYALFLAEPSIAGCVQP